MPSRDDASARARALADLLGVELPIIQAPMAGVQDSALAIAVSAAGALGSLPAAMLDASALRRELGAIRAATDRPVNVNFFCHAPPTPDAAREARWRERLAPYYRELGLDPAATVAAPSRAPFDATMAEVLEELRPAVVSFHFGLPAEPLLQRVRATGARILASATSVGEGRWLDDHGVDAIVAQGIEAGGHRGTFLADAADAHAGLLALVPQLVDAVRVPVIAAGGIADARGVEAAFALGAAGVQAGTAYLCCHEATTRAVHRAALAGEGARHTALTNLFTGRPARGIINRLMRDLGPLDAAAPEFPLAGAALAPLRARAESLGRGDFSPLWCGANASGCRAVPAAEVTRELARGLPGG